MTEETVSTIKTVLIVGGIVVGSITLLTAAGVAIYYGFKANKAANAAALADLKAGRATARAKEYLDAIEDAGYAYKDRAAGILVKRVNA